MPSVLVVRKPDAFSRILESNRFEVFNCPAIETVTIRSEIEIAPEIDGVFVTSRAAAEVFRSAAGFAGKVYVLGRSSFETLHGLGFDVRFDALANTATEMLAAIPESELKGKKFVFVRGEESLRAVPDFLRRFAAVDELVVYRTERVPIDPAIAGRVFDWICFFSPSAADSLIAQAGEEFVRSARLAAIGPTTAEHLKRKGFEIAIVAPRSTPEAFAAEMIEKGKQ